MEIKVLEISKDEATIEIDNLTIIELLRVYLNKDENVIFAAWKREHPTKNPMLKLKTKGKSAKKALSDAIEAVEKDLDGVLNDFKGLK